MKADLDKTKKARLELGEPFALEFSEYTMKVRNNLMFLSVLSIILITNNLVLTKDSSIFGLKLNNFSMDIIYELLFVLISYFIIHFIWLSWDHFVKWKLRLTGSHKSWEGGFAYDVADNKNDISQTTLYSWWLEKTRSVKNEGKKLELILEKFNTDKPTTSDHRKLISEIQELKDIYNTYKNILSHTRIPTSLERFDSWFKYMNTSQSLRWITIELLLPIVIGISAIFIIYTKAF